MSVSAAHFKEVTNGYEKRSDGLWVHKGRADIGWARVTNDLQPTSGAGLELGFVPTTANPYGYIEAFDRDANAYRDLQILGKNITLTPQGGTLGLPAGSVAKVLYDASTTGDIWTNVGLAGGYNGIPGFPVALTLSGGSALVMLQAAAQWGGGATAAVCGWEFYFQSASHTHWSRQYVTTSPAYISVAATAFVAGPLVGSRQFGMAFYTNAAVGSGWYLRPNTASPQEYLRFTVLEMK